MQKYVDVSREAADAGFECRVQVSERVWNQCCEWSEEDTKRQDYQEQDARIWDVVFVPSMKLRMQQGRLDRQGMKYEIYCLLRGEGKEATLIKLCLSKRGQGMVITFSDEVL
jgi:hypothetical protein